jgi:hypothetical protein
MEILFVQLIVFCTLKYVEHEPVTLDVLTLMMSPATSSVINYDQGRLSGIYTVVQFSPGLNSASVHT